jgi:excisionase family DNA binding protein
MKPNKSHSEDFPSAKDHLTHSDSKRILDAKWDGRTAFSIDEVAGILEISRWSAYEATKKGEIPVVQIGGRKIVPRHTLERLLNV